METDGRIQSQGGSAEQSAAMIRSKDAIASRRGKTFSGMHPTPLGVRCGRRRAIAAVALLAATFAWELPTLAAKIPAPNWSITPRNINFGSSKHGASISKSFSIKNTGTATLNGEVGTVTGKDAEAFSILSGGGAFDLDPGKSETVSIQFQATHNGVSKATIPLTSNAKHSKANVLLTARNKGGVPAPTPTATATATPTATPTPVVSTTSTGIAVVATNSGATAYVARGSYEPGSETGIDVVPLEPSHASTTAVVNSLIKTASPAIACSGDSTTGEVVCIGRNNEVFLINGTSLTKTLTSAGQGLADFSGGSCTSCGVTVDPDTNSAVIALNLSPTGPAGGYQVLDLGANTFGPTISNGEEQPSESPALDPVHHLILSPGPSQPGGVSAYGPDYALVMMSPDITAAATATAFDYLHAADVFGEAADLDAAGVDTTTGTIIAADEEATSLFLANISQATFLTGPPNTWDAPAQLQSLPEFSTFLFSGLAAIAVAPVHHLVLAEDEFGGGSFGVIQLPSAFSNLVPAAADWVVANLPSPAGSGVPWAMTGDPHGIGAYDSTASSKGIGLLVNDQHTFLALIDMAALLNAPRTAEGHIVSGSFDLVANGVVTFIALP